jgi:U3 small nucleolar RNA-associated protein 12
MLLVQEPLLEPAARWLSCLSPRLTCGLLPPALPPTLPCAHPLLVCRGEVWSLDVDPGETRLATGSADAELRIYQINAGGEEVGEEAAAAATARGGGPGQPAAAAAAAAAQQAAGGISSTSSTSSFLTPMGSVRRQSGDRVETVRYDIVPGARGGVLLTCQSAGKVTEVYRVRSQAEAAKKMKRRCKRKREKADKRAAAEGDAAEEEARAAEVCACLAGCRGESWAGHTIL